ncbi:hypothetical protein Cgig2_014087 [Carnegiea gigantea]|uniref:Uncharacterized protein n=1 Tax=Carnegiea gigantea TaxID=171969 RepID=A0A9Q1KYC7_9CARY|nr:hypothetical protein Cgig2_014087 [Carnegiea gigantea]
MHENLKAFVRSHGMSRRIAGTDDAMGMHGTPIKSYGTSSTGQEIYPNCDYEFRPNPCKIFNSLQEGTEFYKQYAHRVEFSVQLSSETKKHGVMYWKYCVCSKEGWHKGKDHVIELELSVDVTNKDGSNGSGQPSENKVKSKRQQSLTREGHNHPVATPSKIPMLKSARELEGIPWRHVLVALRGDLKKEISNPLILNRWTKEATRKPIFDNHGTLLEHCVKEKNKAQLITNAWGGFFEVMHYAEANEDDLNMVVEVCKSLNKKLTILGGKVVSKSKDLESFVGCDLPKEVEIHPSKPSTIKGSGKRIKGGKEERRKRWNRNRNILDIAHLVVNMHIMIGEIALQRIKIIY